VQHIVIQIFSSFFRKLKKKPTITLYSIMYPVYFCRKLSAHHCHASSIPSFLYLSCCTQMSLFQAFLTALHICLQTSLLLLIKKYNITINKSVSNKHNHFKKNYHNCLEHNLFYLFSCRKIVSMLLLCFEKSFSISSPFFVY
jgi:hypothetical protein